MTSLSMTRYVPVSPIVRYQSWFGLDSIEIGVDIVLIGIPDFGLVVVSRRAISFNEVLLLFQEFDELAGALLVRTADLNRFIRQDANEALDAMVTYLPPQPCVRALLAKGCR